MTEEIISGRMGETRENRDLFAGSKKEILLQYVVITLGAAIFGLALTLFMLPFKIAPGGVSGLVVVLTHLFDLPAGILLLAFNIPIFVVGIRVLGSSFGFKSLYGTVLLSVFTDLFNEIMHLKMDISDPILAPVFGGVVMGVGLGLIIKMGGATSGSGTLARVLAHYTNMTHGTAILVMNTVIIGFAGIIFRSPDLAMYGLLSLWTSSKIIDAIMEGMDYARGVYIISQKSEAVAELILKSMSRGGTAIKSRGLFTNSEREMIFCVITRKELPDLRSLVKRIDPRAFVIITPVYEVLGEGFRPRI